MIHWEYSTTGQFVIMRPDGSTHLTSSRKVACGAQLKSPDGVSPHITQVTCRECQHEYAEQAPQRSSIFDGDFLIRRRQ